MTNFERGYLAYIKRYRRYVVSRSKQYETHQLTVKVIIKVSDISDKRLKESYTETFFEHLAREYSYKINSIDFHDIEM